MGGRVALHVALAYPEVVGRLVLMSATPGIEDPAERQARRTSDEALARRLESEGVEKFVRWWLGQPLFATLAPERSGAERRLANTAPAWPPACAWRAPGRQQPLWGAGDVAQSGPTRPGRGRRAGHHVLAIARATGRRPSARAPGP